MLAIWRGRAYSLSYLAQGTLVDGGLVPICLPKRSQAHQPLGCINDCLDALGQTFAQALHIEVHCWGAFPKVHFGGQAITKLTVLYRYDHSSSDKEVCGEGGAVEIRE